MFPSLQGKNSRVYHFTALILEHIKKKKNITARETNKGRQRVSKQTNSNQTFNKCKLYQTYFIIKLMLHDITIPKNTWLTTDRLVGLWGRDREGS